MLISQKDHNISRAKIIWSQFLSQQEYIFSASRDVTRLVIARGPLYNIFILSGNTQLQFHVGSFSKSFDIVGSQKSTEKLVSFSNHGTIRVPDYQIFWIIMWHLHWSKLFQVIFLLLLLYLDCTNNQRIIPLGYLLQLLVHCHHEPLSVSFIESVQFLSRILKDYRTVDQESS